MASSSSQSPVSLRPQARPYHEYVAQQQRVLASNHSNADKTGVDGPRLWRQMVIGFTCAGFVGLVMLVLGTVFIAAAIASDQPITVMLCVMAIVFGIIILVGTIILGKLLISRKWIRHRNGRASMAASQCFHTCSVVYSPSLDQLGTSESTYDPPPAYSSVISFVVHPASGSPAAETCGPAHLQHSQDHTSVMVLPPKYEEVTRPLPQYVEKFK